MFYLATKKIIPALIEIFFVLMVKSLDTFFESKINIIEVRKDENFPDLYGNNIHSNVLLNPDQK